MVFSILPKNEQKQFDLRYHSSTVEFFRSFFGRIEETNIINGFRDLLTFRHAFLTETVETPHLEINYYVRKIGGLRSQLN
jgi:hypothetical protein